MIFFELFFKPMSVDLYAEKCAKFLEEALAAYIKNTR